ncbi:Mariner Mos1 transposase [Eumeta japonica]|uniref:Mariner Mos1 transposase n=1 Tax=Eumeta variegata TaxID=151549 RepID=A0A4C1XYV9_EUMVA|nr:Mariner Mos1 transposase [Eumeta japonica]
MFKNGDYDVEDKDRSGRPKMYEDAELEKLLQEDLSQTQKELAHNIRSHSASSLASFKMIHKQVLSVKTNLETLDWEVLPHLPYSSDITPSGYHLFRSMARVLSEQRFTSYEDTKNWIDSWIALKDKEFFRLGI